MATKEQSCKRDAIGAKGATGINMILALLEGALGGLRVRDDWLLPVSLCVGVLWTESPSSSESLYPAEWSEFPQGQGAIAAEFGNVLTELLQTSWLTRWVWRNENCKKEVARSRLGHMLLQGCTA